MSTPHYIGVLRKEAVPYNFYGRLYIEDRRFFLFLHEKSVKDFFETSAPRHLCVLRKDIVRYSSKTNSKQVYDAIADEVFGFREKKEKSETDIHNWAETINQIKDLQDFIISKETGITKFDKALVRRLIERITVFTNYFTFKLKSGVSVNINE